MRPPAAGYDELLGGWESVSATRGVQVRRLPCPPSDRVLLVADVGRPDLPRVALSAGVHGDEPAAPWALLSIVCDGLLDERLAYRVWPCTNPSGYALGTRANADGTDVNRSFSRGGLTPEARAIMAYNEGARYALSLDLHEDYEATGFYCYEPLVDGTAPFGKRLVRAMDDAGLPVHDLDHVFDLGYPAQASHLRALERGRVLPDVAAELAYFEGLPYSIYLVATGTAKRAMTLESPRSRPWDDRIATHRVAVTTTLTALSDRLDRDDRGTDV
jgi:predicted deacylase